MRVAQAFEKSNFDIEVSQFYKDLDEDKYREIDIVASKTVGIPINDNHKKAAILQLIFTCECKNSSSNPWLLLSNKSHKEQLNDNPPLFCHSNLAGDMALVAFSLDEIGKSNKLFTPREHSGFGLVRSLGPHNQADIAYKAIMSASRSAAGLAKQSETLTSMTELIFMNIYFPVIVISGQLFKCQLRASGTIDLLEITQGAITCYNPNTGTTIPSTIEIVTESGLADYLHERTSWIEELFNKFSSGMESLEKLLKGALSNKFPAGSTEALESLGKTMEELKKT